MSSILTFSNRSVKLFTLKNRFLITAKVLHSIRMCLTVQVVWQVEHCGCGSCFKMKAVLNNSSSIDWNIEGERTDGVYYDDDTCNIIIIIIIFVIKIIWTSIFVSAKTKQWPPKVDRQILFIMQLAESNKEPKQSQKGFCDSSFKIVVAGFRESVVLPQLWLRSVSITSLLILTKIVSYNLLIIYID